MSNRPIMRRAVFLFTLVSLLLALVAPTALATDEPAEEAPAEEAPAPAEEPAADVPVPEPAIPIVDDAPAEAEPEWTFRFLVPTALALGAVAVVGTILAYFVKVTKARYRVVE